MNLCPTSRPPPPRPHHRRRPVVQGRDHLPAARQGVLRQQRRRHRRFRRPDPAARLPAGSRRHRALAAAVLSRAPAATTATTSPTTAASIPTSASMKDFRRFMTEAKRRGLRVITELVINHTSDQHPWFQRARRSQRGSRRARLVRLERHRPEISRHPHHLHRHREIELDLGPGGRRLLLAPLLLAPARPQLRQSARAVGDGAGDAPLARPRRRRVPARRHSLSVRARRHQQREPAGDARGHQAAARRARRLRARHRCCSPRPTSGRRTCSAYFGDGDECHMAYHFPLMPRIYMAIAQEDRFPITDILRQTPDIPAELPVGDVPAQPRRADARNGDRRRARLSVVDLCGRSARPHQSRHPPPPRAADGQRPAQDRADELPAAVDAGHADHLLRRRDRHGRQHLSRRPQRRAHADAVDARPQRRLLALRSGASSTCRRSWTRSTATRRSMSRRSRAACRRC